MEMILKTTLKSTYPVSSLSSTIQSPSAIQKKKRANSTKYQMLREKNQLIVKMISNKDFKTSKRL